MPYPPYPAFPPYAPYAPYPPYPEQAPSAPEPSSEPQPPTGFPAPPPSSQLIPQSPPESAGPEPEPVPESAPPEEKRPAGPPPRAILPAEREQPPAEPQVVPETAREQPQPSATPPASSPPEEPELSPSGNNGAANQALAAQLAKAHGHADWTAGQQWADWVELWRRESNWDQNAVDPDSGALGIPQVLGYDTAKTAPGTKVIGGQTHDEYGPDFGLTISQAAAANNGSAYAQILWGIGFIADTYGGPSEALAVHDEYHRY